MKINDPNELTTLVQQNEALTAQLAEFEKAKADLEAATASLAEITTEAEALRSENTELKEAVAASAEVGEQIKAEVQKNTELADQVEAEQKKSSDLTTQLTEKDGEIAELQGRVAAFEEVVIDRITETEAVQDQLALLGQQLGPKALVPDIEETTASNEAPAAYKTWLQLSLSNNPEDRRMARRMQKDNPEIIGFSQKQSGVASSTTTAISTFTSEQVQIFNSWKALRADAEANKKNPTIHANKIVEARRLYKKHQSVIDAQINAAQAA